MGVLTQGTILLTAIGVATLGVILYTPLPDGMEQPWRLREYYAKTKMSVIIGGLAGLVGYSSVNVSRVLLDRIQLTNGSSDNHPNLQVSNVLLDGIQARVYRPINKDGLLPCFIYYHGGGLVYSINIYDGVTAKIANDSDIVVISIEYRKIPEFPYPASIDDGYTATMYILNNGQKLGVDPTKISIGGDSAGGNMAAALALKLRDNKVKAKIVGQVLIYPVLQTCDLHTPSYQLGSNYLYNGRAFAAEVAVMYLGLPSHFKRFIKSENFSSPELTKKCKRFVNHKYLPKEFIPQGYMGTDVTADPTNKDALMLGKKLSDPYVCPLMEEILADLPQTLIVTAELDHIRDDGVIYARRLQKAGVKTEWRHLPDSFHGVLTMIDKDYGFQGGETMINHITNFLKTLYFGV
ncbi:hypothetical protein SNE40_001002 [Patella caerulea]|uniref:Alpha/beta hydrolase fold-3 domain-containing protein n=1 Tax=Patella caerulea TaxID=87958 RepID=A0AAN8Q303_PATCE